MTTPAHFRHYIRVRYQECDSQHVVFNARYGDYIDLAITQYLIHAMPERDPFNNLFEIQLKTQAIEWFQPARFNDVIEIETFAKRFGNTSFAMQFDLRVVEGRAITPRDKVIVRGDATYVHVVDDSGQWKSTPIPADARNLLETGGRGKVVDHAGYFGHDRIPGRSAG